MAGRAHGAITGAASAARKLLGRGSGDDTADVSPPPAEAPVKKVSPVKKASAASKAGPGTGTSKAAKKSAATTAEKTTTKKTTTKKTTTKKTATKKAATEPAPQKTATKPAPQKTVTKKPATRKAAPKKAAASRLAVAEGDAPWTEAELQEVRDDLHEHRGRLDALVRAHEEELAGLMRDAGDGAGHDQADVGATSFERDHELTVVANERETLERIGHALARIDDGSYGLCESCGNPIGKERLMAFPRASLCMTCKQREERR